MTTRPGAWLRALSIGVVSLAVAGCVHDRSEDSRPKTPVYSIEGKQVTLDGGFFEDENGKVSLLTATSGDLDGDADDDQATILVVDSRGSGVFYYLNVLLSDGKGGFEPPREAFLGDRIRFDFMEIYGSGSVSRLTGAPIDAEDYGNLVVGYYVHADGQAFAEKPERYVARHWKIASDRLVLVGDE
jgi:hypothetical protein